MVLLSKICQNIKAALCSRKFWMELGGFSLVCIAFILYMLNLASLHADDLFRKYMDKQQVLKGRITANSVKAQINGRVIIENLSWTDDNDVTILKVPRVEMYVNPFAFAFKTVTEDSLINLDLYDASIVLGFNDKMQLDVLRQKRPEKPLVEKSMQEPRPKNLVWLNKNYPDTVLRLHNFNLIVVHKRRHYTMHDVYLSAQFLDDRYLHIDLHSHEFGGVLKGGICNLNGVVDLEPSKKDINMNLSLFHILPSSLGVQNLNDLADIGAQVTGKLEEPFIQGAISFKELNVGDLRFDKVYGNFSYQKGLVMLDGVTGIFNGGDVEAEGIYNIDSRDYSIDAKGKDIDLTRALKVKELMGHGDVDFHMTVEAPRKKGEKQKQHIWGALKTGPLGYNYYRVGSVQADADIKGSDMLYKDIVVKTDVGNLHLDRLEVKDGRVEIGSLEYDDGVSRRSLPIEKFIRKQK